MTTEGEPNLTDQLVEKSRAAFYERPPLNEEGLPNISADACLQIVDSLEGDPLELLVTLIRETRWQPNDLDTFRYAYESDPTLKNWASTLRSIAGDILSLELSNRHPEVLEEEARRDQIEQQQRHRKYDINP